MSTKDFLRGAGSVLELLPNSRNISPSIPTHTDEEAMKKDLEQVGNDMWQAINKIKQTALS